MKSALSRTYRSRRREKTLFLSIGVCVLFWLTPPSLLSGEADQLIEVPANLPAAQRDVLIRRHADLVKLNLIIKEKVKAHNARCKDIPADSPLVSTCQQELTALHTEIASYHQLVKAFHEDLAKAGSSPELAPADPALDLASHYNPAKVQEEIRGIIAALKQLKSDNEMDNAQREEVEKKSAAATRDAYVLGAHATLDALTAYTQRQIVAQDAELSHEENMLINETDPDRREQLHVAFKILKGRKDELRQAKEGLEKAHDAVDVVEKTESSADGSGEAESKSLLEAGWETCDRLKLLPAGASQAKMIVDAYYDVAVQAYSVREIKVLEDSSEQRLKAITVLSRKLESLIDLQQAHRHPQPAS